MLLLLLRAWPSAVMLPSLPSPASLSRLPLGRVRSRGWLAQGSFARESPTQGGRGTKTQLAN
eukprot:scaffold6759_cov46-Phaeocystis_antarctica.AAC.1